MTNLEHKLPTTTLQPGQALSFQVDDYFRYCHGAPVVAAGQAADR
jgi:hypothetical protein